MNRMEAEQSEAERLINMLQIKNQTQEKVIFDQKHDRIYSKKLIEAANKVIPDLGLKYRNIFKIKIHFIYFIQKIIKKLKQRNIQNLPKIMQEIGSVLSDQFSNLMANKQRLLNINQEEMRLQPKKNQINRNRMRRITKFLGIYYLCIQKGPKACLEQIYEQPKSANSAFNKLNETMENQENQIEKDIGRGRKSYQEQSIDTNQNICFREDLHSLTFYFQFIQSANHQKIQNKSFQPQVLSEPKGSKIYFSQKIANQESEDQIQKEFPQRFHRSYEDSQNYNNSNHKTFQRFKIQQHQIQPEEYYKEHEENEKIISEKSASSISSKEKLLEQNERKNAKKKMKDLVPVYEKFNKALYNWCENLKIVLPTRGYMRYSRNRIAIIAIFYHIKFQMGLSWFVDHQKLYQQFLENFKILLKKQIAQSRIVEHGSDGQIETYLLKKQIPTFKKAFSRFKRGYQKGAVQILFHKNKTDRYIKIALKRLRFIKANILTRSKLLKFASSLSNAFPQAFVRKLFSFQILNQKQFKIKEVKKNDTETMTLDELDQNNRQFWYLIASELYQLFNGAAVIQFYS